jgi:hypothetical protein
MRLVGKQHLDTFLVAAGLFKGHCAGERTGNIAGIFMNAAWDLAGRLFGTASHFERAHVAIRFAGPKQPLIIIHDLAGRGEGFECRTDADVTRLVEGEVLAREGAVVSLDLSMTGMCGAILFSLTSQLRCAADPYCRIRSQLLGLDVEAFLGALDHGLGRAHLGLADGAGGLHIHE